LLLLKLCEKWKSEGISKALSAVFHSFGPPILSLFLLLSFLFTHRVPAHLDAMRVVHSRSRMPSASVDLRSVRAAGTGNCEVRIIERVW